MPIEESKKSKNPHKTCGRPPSKEKDKKKYKVVLNLTKQQKDQLDKIATKYCLSLSQVCIAGLREVEYLKPE